MPHGASLPSSRSATLVAPDRHVRQADSRTDWRRFEPRLRTLHPSAASGGSAADRFVRAIPQALDDLYAAFRENDGEGVRCSAHQIRELAAQVGGLRVTTLAAQVALLATDRDDSCEQWICELGRASTELQTALLDEH